MTPPRPSSEIAREIVSRYYTEGEPHELPRDIAAAIDAALTNGAEMMRTKCLFIVQGSVTQEFAENEIRVLTVESVLGDAGKP